MTDLTALLEKVRSATGADREIDEALMALSYIQEERHIGAVMEYSDGSEERVKDLVWVDPKTDRWVSTAAHSYTASIDAALALAERVLPGWMVVNLCEWEADVLRERGPWNCTLKKIGTQDDFAAAKGACHHASSAPLAIIAATLQALIAKDTQP